MTAPAEDDVAWLLSADAVRQRAHAILAKAERGDLAHFGYQPERLGDAAALVAMVTRESYPDLGVPYHSRWRHFVVEGEDRWAALSAGLGADADEIARIRFDLAVTSVLLDAGAGDRWRYRDKEGVELARSEGLAVASFDLFRSGSFADDPMRAPLRADAATLSAMTEETLGRGFQAGPDNPLVGLEGRAALLRRLGSALTAAPELFGTPGRVGNLYDALKAQTGDGSLPASAILGAVLRGLGPIWPGRIERGGVNLGDTWSHSAVGLVPFHKLSQWLSYSLVEPLEGAGIAVTGLDRLTGLPEYRNGGLLVDSGVLVPKDPRILADELEVGDEAVVEWRALTVALLDRLAEDVRARLGVPAESFPLAKVLQGGTWTAGRRIARDRRPGGGPPIRIRSDGTVF
ncbi:URC4/urg3 family protein [Azospirillum brasilense]|uniref:Uracil phosphoribosyltransferase n=1 Tax=Azospirillum brasilense TaxID=192 RepID=A0A235H3D7_AZOBR|nr:URC4/urg3 family protein [Azospirillum brasilense]OYD80361.1 uracil phosphoribosyltransferase [Azospirillum brasilense]